MIQIDMSDSIVLRAISLSPNEEVFRLSVCRLKADMRDRGTPNSASLKACSISWTSDFAVHVLPRCFIMFLEWCWLRPWITPHAILGIFIS